MKLSEAIRLGCVLRPQAWGCYLSERGSCALGAACEAVGVMAVDGNEPDYSLIAPFPLIATFPILDVKFLHPESQEREPIPLLSIIVSLNDTFIWTRERIADWVQTIEAQFSGQDGAVEAPTGLAKPATEAETSTLSEVKL